LRQAQLARQQRFDEKANKRLQQQQEHERLAAAKQAVEDEKAALENLKVQNPALWAELQKMQQSRK